MSFRTAKPCRAAGRGFRRARAGNVWANRLVLFQTRDGRTVMARWLAGVGLALVAALTLSHGASAQNYPTRTVKIIVPFPAGGTADAMPRIVAEYLTRKWGQPIII